MTIITAQAAGQKVDVSDVWRLCCGAGMLEPRQLPGALTGSELNTDASIRSIAKDHEQS